MLEWTGQIRIYDYTFPDFSFSKWQFFGNNFLTRGQIDPKTLSKIIISYAWMDLPIDFLAFYEKKEQMGLCNFDSSLLSIIPLTTLS